MRHRAIPCMLATAMALSLVAACGSAGSRPGSDTRGSARQSALSAPARQAYDPPAAFDGTRGIALPSAALGKVTITGNVRRPIPVALDSTTAYVAATDSLQAVDLTTGKVTGTLGPRNPAARPSSTLYDGNPADAPLIATVDGKTDAVAAFLEKVPGQGTTAGHLSVELAAMDTGTRQAAWSLLLDVPDGALDPYSTSPSATLLGVHGGTAVVEITDGSHGTAVAVDLRTQKPLWQKEAFLPMALTGSQVVGVALKDASGIEQNVSALDIADGHQVWSLPKDTYGTTIDAAGPTMIMVSARDYESGASSAQLLDAATGHSALDLGGGLAGSRCWYDDRSVIVCATGSATVAVNATDGHPLWSLPDDTHHRVAPKVSAAWHGQVYGTTENGPVILDARTGADRPGSPTIAPLLVDGYVGLALGDKQFELLAYPTTG